MKRLHLLLAAGLAGLAIAACGGESAPPDTGTGSPDAVASTADAGLAADAAPPADAGFAEDARAPADTGPADAGPGDTGRFDAARPDAMADAGRMDAMVPDTGPRDSGVLPGAPVVTLVQPARGARISGVALIRARVSGMDVQQVEYLADDVLIGFLRNPPFDLSFDTTSVIDGDYRLTVRASDAMGRVGVASVDVTVVNPGANAGDAKPDVRLMYPIASSTVCGTITVRARASDDVAIARVVLSADARVLATLTAPPYTATWDTSTLANGPHRVRVTAADDAGQEAQRTVWVNVRNAGPCDNRPFVSITMPAGAYVSGSSVGVAAEASDDMSVTSIEISLDNVVLGRGAASPFAVTWQTLGAVEGVHLIRARATDTAGQVSEDARMVTLDNTPPAVMLLAPAANSTSATAVLQLRAAASDNTGVQRVDFTIDGTVAATAVGAPYMARVTMVRSGTRAVGAEAVDLAGNVARAGPVPVVIDLPPAVSIRAPISGTRLRGRVAVIADASDDLGLRSVELWAGGVLLARRTAGPFEATWNAGALPNGPYVLEAIAEDSRGNRTRAVSNVTIDDRPPVVSFVNPHENDTVSGRVTVNLDARDDEPLPAVRLTVDGALLQLFGAPPYQTIWDTCAQDDGRHTLRAEAQDTRAQTASASISLAVANAAVPPMLTGRAGATNNDLTWTTCRSRGITFNLYVSSTPGVTTTSTVIPLGFVSAYRHGGVVQGRAYYYRVAEVDSGRVGPLSNEVQLLPATEYQVAITRPTATEIWAVSSAGFRLDRAIAQTDTSGRPAWSEDGRLLAYHFNRLNGPENLSLVAIYDYASATVLEEVRGEAPALSADATKILTDDAGMNCLRVHDRGAMSSTDRCYREDGRGWAQWDPAGGYRMAFLWQNHGTGNQELVIRNDVTGNRFQVAVAVRSNFSWSPDGTQLAYLVPSAGGRCELQLATVAATMALGRATLVTGLDCQSVVHISPAGGMLAFNDATTGSIYTLALPAGASTPVTMLTPIGTLQRPVRHMAWSSDGARLLLSARIDASNFTLYIAPPNGPISPVFDRTGAGDFAVRP